MLRFPAVIGLTLLLAGAGVSSADAPPAGSEPPAAWRRWSRQLDADAFELRQQASRELELQPSLPAVAWLDDLARSHHPEAATRAVAILERWFSQRTDEIADAAEQALQALAYDPSQSTARLAAEALRTHEHLRESRAIARLKELGAKIDMGPDYIALAAQYNVENADARWGGAAEYELLERLADKENRTIRREGTPQAVGSVILSSDWKGTADDLWHLGRLRGKQAFKVLIIRGSGVDENEVHAAIANLPSVDRPEIRGPSLGITNNRASPYAQVGRVLKGGAAEKAGIQPGDQIVSINGERTELFKDVIDAITESELGATVEIEVFRQGELQTIKAQLGDWAETDTEGTLWDLDAVSGQLMQPRAIFPPPFNPGPAPDLQK